MVTTIAANNMEQLHQDILDGEVEPPARFSKLGREYNRWLRTQKSRLTSSTDSAAALVESYQCVKKTLSELCTAAALLAETLGFRSAIRPSEWQTTTNLGCGFNPNVVGAAAPVVEHL